MLSLLVVINQVVNLGICAASGTKRESKTGIGKKEFVARGSKAPLAASAPST
jgi:hypothetical protein